MAKPGKLGPQITAHTDDSQCVSWRRNFRPLGIKAAWRRRSILLAALPPLPCGVFTGSRNTPGQMHIGGRKVPLSLVATTSWMAGSDFHRRIKPLDGDFRFVAGVHASGRPTVPLRSTPPMLGAALVEAICRNSWGSNWSRQRLPLT